MGRGWNRGGPRQRGNQRYRNRARQRERRWHQRRDARKTRSRRRNLTPMLQERSWPRRPAGPWDSSLEETLQGWWDRWTDWGWGLLKRFYAWIFPPEEPEPPIRFLPGTMEAPEEEQGEAIEDESEPPPPLELQVGPPDETPTCPYCADPLDVPDQVIVYCERCSTPHHRDCWREGKRCTTFGCGAKAYRRRLV